MRSSEAGRLYEHAKTPSSAKEQPEGQLLIPLCKVTYDDSIKKCIIQLFPHVIRIYRRNQLRKSDLLPEATLRA
jgi:hypothetical protein